MPSLALDTGHCLAGMTRQCVRFLAKKFTHEVRKKVKPEHYPAPYAVIDNWQQWGIASPMALQQEARSIAKLFLHDTSKNLVRVFFLQTRLKALAKGVDFAAKQIHVVVMGGDIAAWCALQGLYVTLIRHKHHQVIG